ncbi:ATP-binding protein [Streptomyces sp. NPDC052016]|uniref:ATP-binding protein n=1 Tax=Streptomyces sp. NPDC052016 TaxID=3365680 RepID=UPI0037D45C68
MDIDTSQPWGLAIDYAGRATLTEAGHTVYVNVSDTSFNSIIAPDSITGTYSPVTITAQFSETGDNGAVLRGTGRVTVMPVGTDPVVPDRTAVQRAVAAALADFRANTAAYVALCAAWTTDEGEGQGDGDTGTGGETDQATGTETDTGTGTDTDTGTETDSGTEPTA